MLCPYCVLLPFENRYILLTNQETAANETALLPLGEVLYYLTLFVGCLICFLYQMGNISLLCLQHLYEDACRQMRFLQNSRKFTV
jgi:hypothetical protein